MHLYQDKEFINHPMSLSTAHMVAGWCGSQMQINVPKCINYIIFHTKTNPYDCRNCSHLITVATKPPSDSGPKRGVQTLIPVIAASPSPLIAIAPKQSFYLLWKRGVIMAYPYDCHEFSSSYCHSNEAVNLFRSRAKRGVIKTA